MATLKATIRCPACSKLIQLPAMVCPFCKVDLKEAALPKKAKFGVLRYIVFILIALFFLTVAGWLVYVAITDVSIIPDFISDRAPNWLKDLIGKIHGFFIDKPSPTK